jgi:hypothetical protein
MFVTQILSTKSPGPDPEPKNIMSTKRFGIAGTTNYRKK